MVLQCFQSIIHNPVLEFYQNLLTAEDHFLVGYKTKTKTKKATIKEKIINLRRVWVTEFVKQNKHCFTSVLGC